MPSAVVPSPASQTWLGGPPGWPKSPRRRLCCTAGLRWNPNRVVRVHSQFTGDVIEIGKIRDELAGPAGETSERDLRPGDRVAKGQLLAVVWNKELGEKKSDLADALSKKHFSEEEFQHMRGLVGESVTQRHLIEAQKQVELDAAAVQRIERTLRAWRVSEEEIKSRARRRGDPPRAG